MLDNFLNSFNGFNVQALLITPNRFVLRSPYRSLTPSSFAQYPKDAYSFIEYHLPDLVLRALLLYLTQLMAKKKKNNKKRRPKALTAAALEKRLVDLFSKQVTARFDAKNVIKKLRITNSKDAVQHGLEQLVKKGILDVSSKGTKTEKTAKLEAQKSPQTPPSQERQRALGHRSGGCNPSWFSLHHL